jgi:hypothetical protein
VCYLRRRQHLVVQRRQRQQHLLGHQHCGGVVGLQIRQTNTDKGPQPSRISWRNNNVKAAATQLLLPHTEFPLLQGGRC